MDPWKTLDVVCEGGLIINQDILTQAKILPGAADILLNYEPSIYGGYARIKGYAAYDSTAVTGSGNVLGVCVFGPDSKVVASRSTDMYESSGSGWSKINGANSRSSSNRHRFEKFNFGTDKIATVDGANYAATWDGTTFTLLNGSGAPTAPAHVAAWRSRLILSNGNSIVISVPDDETDYTSANGAIEINVGDTITGLKSFRDSLYIFCKNRIFELTGTTSTNFVVSPVTTNIGCVASDSIQEIGGDLVFLGPDGIRTIAGTSKIGDVEKESISRNIQPVINEILSVSGGYSQVVSTVIREKSQYRLFYPNSNTEEYLCKGIIGGLHENLSRGGLQWEWATLRGIKPTCCDSDFIGDTEYIVHGATDGKVYRQESGNSFNGTNIEAIFRTVDLDFGDASVRKVLYKLSVNYGVTGAASITTQTIVDQGNAMVIQPSELITLSTDGVAIYDDPNTVYDTALYSNSTEYPFNKNNLVGSGFMFAFRFVTNDSNAPHTIQSFKIQYRTLDRK